MASDTTFASAASGQTLFYFDIKPYVNYFERPDYAVLGAATRAVFPSDPALGFTEMRGRMAGCFKVASTTQPNVNYVTISRKKLGGTGLEEVQVPLRPLSPSGGTRREGTLVTIVEADLGPDRHIPGTAFDAAMGQFGEVVMRTKPQLDKRTNLYNTNRMVVVDTTDAKNPLPDRLQVGERSFLIKYKGKKWHCSSCSDMHVGACPYLKAFYEALERKRALKDVKHAIMADSTLRHADHVGVAADMMAMPGATVGQLATACSNITSSKPFTEFFLVGGANDIDIRDDKSEFVVAKKIDKSMKNLVRVAALHRNIQFNLFNSSPPPKDFSPLEKFAKMYFRDRLKKVFKDSPNISVLKGVPYTEDWGADKHPTPNCTKDIVLGVLANHKSLVIDEDYLVNEQTYRGVEKCWLSACTGCASRGHFREGFCPKCFEEVQNGDAYDDFPHLKKLSEKILGDDFTTRKRRHDSSSSNSSDKIDSKVKITARVYNADIPTVTDDESDMSDS